MILKAKSILLHHSNIILLMLALRNVRLNFRQQEENHIMENIIYNELLVRDFNVDVGIVSIIPKNVEGKQEKVNLEVDFVCNKGSQRAYSVRFFHS